MSLKNNATFVELDFGDGPQNCTLGNDLASNYWHNITILHDHKTVKVILDREQIKIFDNAKNWLFDPEVSVRCSMGGNLLLPGGVTHGVQG